MIKRIKLKVREGRKESGTELVKQVYIFVKDTLIDNLIDNEDVASIIKIATLLNCIVHKL